MLEYYGLVILIIAFISIFSSGYYMLLRSKGIRPMAWRDGIDIPRAKKKLFVLGWIQMVLTVICIGVNWWQIGSIFNTMLGVIAIISSVKIMTMSRGSELVPNGVFGILFGIQVAGIGIARIVNSF